MKTSRCCFFLGRFPEKPTFFTFWGVFHSKQLDMFAFWGVFWSKQIDVFDFAWAFSGRKMSMFGSLVRAGQRGPWASTGLAWPVGPSSRAWPVGEYGIRGVPSYVLAASCHVSLWRGVKCPQRVQSSLVPAACIHMSPRHAVTDWRRCDNVAAPPPLVRLS